MTNHRVQNFPIGQLEYVFVPPGLPLVTKSDSPATTSILVRGGAGTGKTTLAAALAHSISRDQGGVALYLTTEFVATELAYKAVMLGLGDDMVDAWDSVSVHQPGTLLAEHLVRTDAGSKEEALRTVAERKRAALDAVWELLAHGADTIAAERGEDRPVRVVVIDGFGLPEVEQEDRELRHQLVSSMQALERIGITPIIVEEAGIHSEAWLPFVVDIVFEIELWPDPDTRLLHRKLKCPKSRYVRGIPGPHEYGMESGVPVLWPSLPIDVCRGMHWQEELAPSFFYPIYGSKYALCKAGSVIVSELGKRELVSLVKRVPGMQIAGLQCGPLNTVLLPDGQSMISDESNGLLAVGWTILRGFRDGRLNAVTIEGLEHHLARSHTSDHALHLIGLLSAAGITVCVHGQTTKLKEVTNFADVTLSTQYSGRVQRNAISLGPCRADRWLEVIADPMARELFEGTLAPAGVLALKEVEGAGDLEESARLRAAILTHLASGVRRFVEGNMASQAARARFAAFTGNDLKAACHCLEDIESSQLSELWDGISATFTGNRAFSEALLSQIEELHPRELVRLLRIYEKNVEDVEHVASVVSTAATRFELPIWYALRLASESFMARQQWRDARHQLATLAEATTIPSVHRAEIFHNLGVAHGYLGDAPAARIAYERALEFNPLLEPAQEALKK